MAYRIVIAGGGTAGWMCAAAMARMAVPAGFEVTLVESEEIGAIGVGEATIPTLHTFNAMLGLNEDAFVAATQGTFKLGIEFVDWGALDTRYLHPFGQAGQNRDGVYFHQFWLRQKLAGDTDAGAFEDYSLCVAAARKARFGRPEPGFHPIYSSLKYAFHFDAALYARFLRSYAERAGVVRLEGRIADVARHPGSGNLSALRLADGRTIDGDFFIDCTGMRALLIDGALGVPYEDWSQYLPCDRALALPCERAAGPLLSYTRSTADAAGWRWRIPLQHRTGCGHVYSSAFMTDDEAEARLRAGLDAPALAEARPIRFRTGRRQSFWKANCVAIGLSAGFLEPLESTSIHLIQTAIAKLMALFPSPSTSPAEIAEFNTQTAREYEQARDFLVLHYTATQRTDSPFWQHCRTMPIPDSLAHKIALFRDRGRVFRMQDDLFTENSWISVLLGQGVLPSACDPLTQGMSEKACQAFLRDIRTIVASAAAAMPDHGTFVAGICSAG